MLHFAVSNVIMLRTSFKANVRVFLQKGTDFHFTIFVRCSGRIARKVPRGKLLTQSQIEHFKG